MQTVRITDKRRLRFVSQSLLQIAKGADAILLAQSVWGFYLQRIVENMIQAPHPYRQQFDLIGQQGPQMPNVSPADGTQADDQHSHKLAATAFRPTRIIPNFINPLLVASA